MLISPTQALLVMAVLLASSIVQGAVGFAAGLFGIPLFLLAGLTLPQAVAIALVASTVQNFTAAWRLRADIDYRRALRPIGIRLLSLPLGAYALYLAGNAGRDATSQAVGCVVLAIVAAQQWLRIPPRDELHAAWEWLAFGLGGFLLGFCGMGGPPMVVWVLAHRWSAVRAKAFLFFVFSTGIPPQALCLYLFFGLDIFRWMFVGLLGIPVLVVGTLVGLRISAGVNDQWMRRVSMLTLVLIALLAIIVPWLR